ncbi:MAG: DUF721 domain-containing protein [Desulfococcaceae bacterium]|jgi:predicted nucleic acid-binding Zn ribbon protein|nr:DUF721 domain-containing protein [Desulfococcaceae bacterium]
MNNLQRKNQKSFLHIADILSETVAVYRTESDQELTRIWKCWDSAVGPAIAENTRPAAFKGSLLIVHVSASAWVHQLQYLKQELMEKINRVLGKKLVEDIRFKIGDI